MIVIDLVDSRVLLNGRYPGLLRCCYLFHSFEDFLLHDLIDEKGSIFASGEQEARVLCAHKLCDVAFMRESLRYSLISVWMQLALNFTLARAHSESLDIS